MTTQWQDNWSM